MPGVGMDDEPEEISGERSNQGEESKQEDNHTQEQEGDKDEDESLRIEDDALDEVEFDMTMSALAPTECLTKTIEIESKEVCVGRSLARVSRSVDSFLPLTSMCFSFVVFGFS